MRYLTPTNTSEPTLAAYKNKRAAIVPDEFQFSLPQLFVTVNISTFDHSLPFFLPRCLKFHALFAFFASLFAHSVTLYAKVRPSDFFHSAASATSADAAELSMRHVVALNQNITLLTKTKENHVRDCS